MDLSKAFGCLTHGFIIAELHTYALGLPVSKLSFSYFLGRKQHVDIISLLTALTKGVSQISIPGFLLLKSFMSDLFLFIDKYHSNNYARDNPLDPSFEYLVNVLYNLRTHDVMLVTLMSVLQKWFASQLREVSLFAFSPASTKQQVLQIGDGMSLMSETDVTS